MPDLPELTGMPLRNSETGLTVPYKFSDRTAYDSLMNSARIITEAENNSQIPAGIGHDEDRAQVFPLISVDGQAQQVGTPAQLPCNTYGDRLTRLEARTDAVWDALKPKTVRFFSQDGVTLLYTAQNVTWGTAATFAGTTPTKASTAQYDYAFVGWATATGSTAANANLSSVKQDMDVYAAFSETLRKYTVTYKTYDGASTIDTEEVEYGSNGTKVNSTARTSTVQYDYTPDGWSLTANGSKDTNALSNITADRIVFASYISTLRKYTVTFMNGSSTVTTKEVEYGSNATYTGASPTKTATAQYTYTFVGWALSDNQEEADDNALTNIIADRTVFAAYSKTVNQYTVTFYNGNTVVGTSTQDYGANATYTGATPVKASSASTDYTFVGWAASDGQQTAVANILNNITANKSVFAAYSESVRKYTVTFYAYDGATSYGSVQVNYGSNATYSGTTPTHGSDSDYAYKFLGWASSTNATSATSGILNNIQADKDVYAAFEHIQYTVYFAAGDSGYAYTLNPSASTEYGDMITISDKTTTKSSTSSYRYEFKGWTNIPNQIQTDTQIPVWGSNSITLDETKFAMDKTAKTATLYPVFIQTANTITVNWRDWTGTILTTTEVNAGTTITAISFPSGVPSRMLGYRAESSGTLSQVQYKYEPYGYYKNNASDPTGYKNNPAYGMGSFNITTPENDTGIVATNSIVNANSGCIEMTLVYSYSYYNVTLQLLSHDGSIVIWSLTDSTENLSSTGNNVQKQKQILSSICNTVSGTQSFSKSSSNTDMLGVLMRSEFGYNYTGDNPPVPSGLSHTPQSVITSYMPLKQYFEGGTSDKSYTISATNVIVASTGLHNGDNYFITLDDTSSNILAKMYVVYANSDSNAVLLPYLAKFSVAYMGLNRHIYQNSSNLRYIDRNDSPTAFTNLNNTSSTWANVVTPQDQSYTLYGWESQPSTMTNSDTSDTTYPVIMDSQDTSLVDERASVSTAITLSAHLGDTSMSYANVRAKATFDLGDFVSTDYLLYDNTDTAKNQNLISTRNSPFFAHMPVILFHAVYEHEQVYTWQDIVDMCNDGTYKDDTKLPLGTIVPLNVNASSLSCATQIANAVDAGTTNLDATNKTFTLHMCLVAKDEYVDYYNGATTGTNKARNKTTWLSLDRIPGTERWYSSASSSLEWTSSYPHDVVDDCQTLSNRVSAFGSVVGNAMVPSIRWGNSPTNGTYSSESCYLYVPSVNELCGASGLSSNYTGGFSTSYSNRYAIDSKEFELYAYQWHDSQSVSSSWASSSYSYTASNETVTTGTRDNSTSAVNTAAIFKGSINDTYHAIFTDNETKRAYLAYHWGFCIGYAGVADEDKETFTVAAAGTPSAQNFTTRSSELTIGRTTVSGAGDGWVVSSSFDPPYVSGASIDTSNNNVFTRTYMPYANLLKATNVNQYATAGDCTSSVGSNVSSFISSTTSSTTYTSGEIYATSLDLFTNSGLAAVDTSKSPMGVIGNVCVRMEKVSSASAGTPRYCYVFINHCTDGVSTWGLSNYGQYYAPAVAMVGQYTDGTDIWNYYRIVAARRYNGYQQYADDVNDTTLAFRGITGLAATDATGRVLVTDSWNIVKNMPTYSASDINALSRDLCNNGNRLKVWRGDYIGIKLTDAMKSSTAAVMGFDVYQTATDLTNTDTSKCVMAYTPCRLTFPSGQNPFDTMRYVPSSLT